MTMDLKLFGLIAIYFVGVVSCESGEDDRGRLYGQVFKATEPLADRDQIITMLRDLRKLSEHDETLIRRIDELLEISEISGDKCRNSQFVFADYKTTGRAKQLVAASQQLQAKLCKSLWEESLLPLISELGEDDKTLVSSIIKNMIDANNGQDFTSDWLQMPYEIAQEGVLRHMESYMKGKIGPDISQDEFDKVFTDYVLEPCKRVTFKLEPFYEKYMYLIRFRNSGELPNPIAYDWAKNSLICKRLKGSGYSSERYETFQRNIFSNLKYRQKN